MIDNLNWPTLETRRVRYRLILFYKIIHQIVAVNIPINLLIPVDNITRHTNPYCYKHIPVNKDSYKFSFYPRTVIQWNLLPLAAHEAITVDNFKALIPVSTLPTMI